MTYLTEQGTAPNWFDPYAAKIATTEFVSSVVEPAEVLELPIVKFGIRPTDEYIGW